MRSTRLRAAALLIPLALLPALSACAPEESAPEVASLPTPSAPTTESRTDGAGTSGDRQGSTDTAGRPVFRVDDTEERRRALWNPYLTCLLDHGAKPPAPGSMSVGLGDVAVDLPGPPKARAACQQLEPLQPPALDASTNPDFRD